MGHARFVGRVGALAVALGVGSALATNPVVAWAAPGDGESSSSASKDASTESSSQSTTDAGGDVKASGSTPKTTSGHAKPHGHGSDPAKLKVKPKKVSSPAKVTAKPTTRAAAKEETATAPPTASTATVSTSATDHPASVSAVARTEHVVKQLATAPATVLSGVLTAVSDALSGNGPDTPVETPAVWILAAAARRQLGATAHTPAVSAVAAAAASNLPPVVGPPRFGTADPTTGAVTGQIVASDPDSAALTYTVKTAPSDGRLVLDGKTGAFTYTPTTTQRIRAQVTTAVDTVPFTVTVSDGKTKVSSTVDVPVSPTPVTEVNRIPTGNGSGGLAATNTRAYVTNSADGTVTVIDTIDGTVVGTVVVGSKPTGIAVTPDGKKVYVSNSGDGTISVIDAATMSVTGAPIVVSGKSPGVMTISPDGKTVYVGTQAVGANGQPALDRSGKPVGGYITRISTATDKVIGTSAKVGDRPVAITVSPDGKKVYAISATLDPNTLDDAGTRVYAVGSGSAKVLSGVGTSPTAIAVSPDGVKLFVAGTGSLAIVQLSSDEVLAMHTLTGMPSALTFNQDGSLVFVGTSTGSLGVYDPNTGALLTSTETFAASPSPFSRIVASPDGQQLYTLGVDVRGSALQVISLVPTGNQFPTVGAASVNPPNTTTGVVAGTVTASDPDHDALTYTASTPSRGKVVVNADGSFVYTPTASARHDAAAVGADPSALTDGFTITVSDGRRGIVTVPVSVSILPADTDPTTKVTVGTPSSSTGVVKGAVTGKDADKDVLTYSGSTTTAKGTVVVDAATGKYVYTPTAEARHAAATTDTAAKTDTFAITVTDGHGASVPVSVTVKISPTNAKPEDARATVTQTDPGSGELSGTLGATDSDADAFTYSATPKKGTISFGPGDVFTYVPTAAARAAASDPKASASAKSETVTITVDDGHGGTDTVSVKFAITPYDVA